MNVHSFRVPTADGGEKPLSDYAGRYLLIVNVASKCGFTPQYEGLEALNQRFAGRVQVLGFPCNQFGDQEPGTDSEIQDFCTSTYSVTFPVFAKIDVNGPGATPLYRYLKDSVPAPFERGAPGVGTFYDHIEANYPALLGTSEIKWNFTKFLVDGDGEVVRRYETLVTPEEIGDDLAALPA